MNSDESIMPTDITVLEAQMRAEIDVSIATAKHYPRNLQRSHSTALAMVESSKEIAMSCIYSKPVGGDRITGPSIRLAEIMLYSWQNLRVKSEFVEERNDYVLVQAVAMDLENNIAVSSQVRRRIIDKDGKRYKTDVIQTTVEAARAIAERNAIFKVIPFAFVRPIYEAARELAVGKETEFDAQRARCVKHFQTLGIPSPTLLLHLGKLKVTDIKRDDIEYLIGVINAIKEGESVDEIFAMTRTGKPMAPSATPESAKETLKDVAAKAKAATKGKQAAKSEPKAEPVPDEDGVIPDDGEGSDDEAPWNPEGHEPEPATETEATLC